MEDAARLSQIEIVAEKEFNRAVAPGLVFAQDARGETDMSGAPRVFRDILFDSTFAEYDQDGCLAPALSSPSASPICLDSAVSSSPVAVSSPFIAPALASPSTSHSASHSPC